MKIKIAFLFLLHTSLGLMKNYSDYTLFRSTPVTDTELEFLEHLGDKIKIDFWRQPGTVNMSVDMMIGPDDQKTFRRLMYERNYLYEVVIDDVQREFDEQTVKNYTRRKMDTFDWAHYFRLNDIYEWLQDIANERPDEVNIITLGRTVENRPILALRVLLKGSKNRSTVIIEGGAHAREWISPAFVTYMISLIVNSDRQNNTELRNISSTYEWYFIPVLNPDGYEYSHSQDRMWRKNRRWGIGVDIIRNFDVAFGGKGSSSVPRAATYCGPKAFSEEESKAIRELTHSKAATLEYYLAFHSYGQVIILPHTHLTEHYYNYDEVKNMMVEAAKKISVRFRTVYQTGTLKETLGYLASGVSFCWVKAKFLTPYAVVFELRDSGQHGFALPANLILPTCQETMDGVLSFLKPRTDKFEKTSGLNDPHFLTPRPDTLFEMFSSGQNIKYLNAFVFFNYLLFYYTAY